MVMRHSGVKCVVNNVIKFLITNPFSGTNVCHDLVLLGAFVVNLTGWLGRPRVSINHYWMVRSS